MHVDPQYRADIDGLRALAVAGVVIFHALPGVLPGGFAGVDVFFVISGYLIGSIILNGVRAGTFSFRAFYHRRILRLLPAMALVSLVTVLIGAVLLVPGAFSTLTFTLRAAILYVSNIVFALRTGYFDQSGASAPFLHTWSLAVEEQFYLAMPLLIWGVYRWKPRAVWPILAALLLLSLAAGIHGSIAYPEKAFFLTHGRIWELLLGVLLAYAPRLDAVGRGLRSCIGWLGLGAILAAYALHEGETARYPGFAALLPCLGAVFLIEANRASATSSGRFLSWAPFTYLGRISYPLYLWHWPILVYLRAFGPDGAGLIPSLIAIATSVLLADLTYRLVERPIRFGRVISWKSSYAALAIISVIFVGFSLISEATKGLPQRFSKEVRAVLETGQEWQKSTRMAWMQAGNSLAFAPRMAAEHACRIGDRSASIDVILWGDSHAAGFQPALDQLLKQEKRGGIVLSSVCRPISVTQDEGYLREGCAAKVEKAFADFLASDAKVLVLAQRWTSLIEGAMPIEREYARLSDDDKDQRQARLQAGLRAFALRIEQGGKRLVLLETVPEMPFHVPNTLGFRMNLRLSVPAAPTLADVMARQKRAKDALQVGMAGTRAMRLDPLPVLCTHECPYMREGKPLYFDNNHLTSAAFPLIERFLVQNSNTFR